MVSCPTYRHTAVTSVFATVAFCLPHKNGVTYKSINLGFYFEIHFIFKLKVFRI